MQSVSTVIPFYNEYRGLERVIGSLCSALDASGWRYELVCVNNGSTDGTGALLARIAERNPSITLVTVHENKGYGYGIRAGLEVATHDIVGYIDGDGQVAPNDLLRVLDAQQGADAVKAVRATRGDGLERKVISLIYNMLFRVLFGITTPDANAKPKFFTRRVYEKLHLVSDDWFIDAEIMIKTQRLGVSWRSVPVSFVRRKMGTSHVKIYTMLEFIKNIFIWRCGFQNIK